MSWVWLYCWVCKPGSPSALGDVSVVHHFIIRCASYWTLSLGVANSGDEEDRHRGRRWSACTWSCLLPWQADAGMRACEGGDDVTDVWLDALALLLWSDSSCAHSRARAAIDVVRPLNATAIVRRANATAVCATMSCPLRNCMPMNSSRLICATYPPCPSFVSLIATYARSWPWLRAILLGTRKRG